MDFARLASRYQLFEVFENRYPPLLHFSTRVEQMPEYLVTFINNYDIIRPVARIESRLTFLMQRINTTPYPNNVPVSLVRTSVT